MTTTVKISGKHYEELLFITHAMRTLARFFDDSDIDFPATDLTPALHSLCHRLSVITQLNKSNVTIITQFEKVQETYLDEDVFPASCPWDLADVVNQDFLPD